VYSRRGFTLIEVVIVMAIIAISLGLAAPRIGAGIGSLELNQAVQTVRTYIRLARFQAQRSDREQYVIVDPTRRSVAFVGPEMNVLREETLPNSVDVVLEPGVQTGILYVAPSGLWRGNAVWLMGRNGRRVEVSAP
jgi:prepilin-type N-terminal cleavage/methylation domain-containing protein